jgi:2-keto-3-deoxy-L-fuconate dehydrogenase
MNELTNRKALVTGAAAGIGRATVLALANDGADVWAADLDENGLQELAKLNNRVRPVPLDLTDTASVRCVVEDAGGG